MPINETHDPNLKSFVDSANAEGADFPIQNLPLVTFTFAGSHDEPTRLGVAIGDEVLDLMAASEENFLAEDLQLNGPDSFLDLFEALEAGNEYSEQLRAWASRELRCGEQALAGEEAAHAADATAR
jgi:fumarylacetoacetase